MLIYQGAGYSGVTHMRNGMQARTRSSHRKVYPGAAEGDSSATVSAVASALDFRLALGVSVRIFQEWTLATAVVILRTRKARAAVQAEQATVLQSTEGPVGSEVPTFARAIVSLRH